MNSDKIFITLIMLSILAFSVYGFTTLSVSKVDFISNDPNIGGNSFLLTGVAGLDSSSKIEASDISDGTTKATKSLYIDLIKEEYSCDYSFVNSNENYIWTLSIYPQEFWTAEECRNIQLPTNQQLYFPIRPQTSPLFDQFSKFRCVIGTKVYNVGFISNPQENFDLEFGLNNGVETLNSGTLSSKTISQVTFDRYGKRYATIDWLGGGLITPDYCPMGSTTLLRAIQNHGDTSDFTMISDAEYQVYTNFKDSVQSEATALTGVILPDFGFNEKLQIILDKTNNIVNNFKKTNQLVGANGQTYDLVNVPNVPEKTINIDKPTILPVFTIRVNADWLGVVIPVGKPDIISYDPTTIGFKSGIGRYLSVIVKNVGNGAGNFVGFAECEGDIITTNDVTSIEPGKTSELKIFFNANIVKDECEKCKIVVYDKNSQVNRDEFNIQACSSPVLELVEGDLTCIGDTIHVAKQNVWVKLQECDYGCEITEPGKAECKIRDQICSSDQECPTDYSCIKGDCVTKSSKKINLLGVSLILGIIFAILLTVLIAGSIPKFKARWLVLFAIFVILLIILVFVFGAIINLIVSSYLSVTGLFSI